MKLKFTYLIITCLFLLVDNTSMSNTVKDDFKLLTKVNQFTAGDVIVLEFSTSKNSKPKLYISHSYGNTVLKPTLKSDILYFTFPKTISNKAGVINWQLLSSDGTLSGILQIAPLAEVNTMETYLGPPSIAAGGNDFSMLVVMPTDVYDNTLPDSTKVNIKHQFLDNEYNNSVTTEHGISYLNIFSETKSGRMLVSSECMEKNSKEFTINVLPNIPTNFIIDFERHHEYADGNQVTSFSTSIIKDTYGNIVSDGTYVAFYISNQDEAILKTSGTTVNGIASAKMIHPDHEDNWSVKALIEGIAESNSLQLAYKSALSDYDIHFSDDNRTITVGPLRSFMNQMIPDGLEVSLSVFKDEKLIKNLIKPSFEGYATFTLDDNNFPNDTYNFEIEVAGIIKPVTNKKI